MTALGMGLIVFIVAIAVDSTRLVQASSKLKTLNDMAALAATEGQNKTLSERKAIYEQYMENGIQNSRELEGYEYTLTYETNGTSSTLSVTSRSEAQLFFPVTRGEGKFVGALSEVTVGNEFIEVALVLDISSSMNGAKIVELQNSATNFVQTLFDNQGIQNRVSISVIPYGGSVRLPAGLVSMLNPPATNQHWIDGQWNGCLFLSPADYSAGLTPQHKLNFMPDYTSYAPRNNWCPRAGNEMLGLTKNQTTLNNKIAALTLSDGTGTDIGVAWGLATLDREWRGEIDGVSGSSPRNFNARTKKFMLVMSDGGITGQNYPLDSELTGSLPYHTNNEIIPKTDTNMGYKSLCDLTKSKGIEVFTIGFDLNTPERINALQYCGSSAEHNHEADKGQLTTVFENIARSISGLRLSQ